MLFIIWKWRRLKEVSNGYIEYFADLVKVLNVEVLTITAKFSSRNETDRFIAHFI